MSCIQCEFCSDDATGLTLGGAPTCGCETCEPIAKPLPEVIEVSGPDDENDNGEIDEH